MKTTYLPGTGRITSRLGFGTTGLCGELTPKEALRLLETSYEAGIRHYDTAPLYGGGESERLLGEFLDQSHKDATVATKFGLLPTKGRWLLSLGRATLRPLLRQLPGLKPGLTSSIKRWEPAPNYTAEALRISLRHSLSALRRDRVDLLLLHDPPDESWLSPELYRALEDLVRSGMIGAWGIGGRRTVIDRVVACGVAAPSVAQFEWSVLSDNPPIGPGAFTITYGAISTTIGKIQALLSEGARRREWSDWIGCDLFAEHNLSRLLIAVSLRANKRGIVLFSSKKSARISIMAEAMETTTLSEIDKFVQLLEEHRRLLVL